MAIEEERSSVLNDLVEDASTLKAKLGASEARTGELESRNSLALTEIDELSAKIS